MHAFLAAVVLGVSTGAYLPPQSWALGFGAVPRIPLAGDVDGDGLADLLCVYPPGSSIVDVSLSVDGHKSGFPFQGLTGWGRDCQAALAGEFDEAPGADVMGLFEGKRLKLAGAYREGKFGTAPDVLTLPQELPSPVLGRWDDRSIVAFSSSSGTGWRIFTDDWRTEQIRLPKGLVFLGDAGQRLAVQDTRGRVSLLDRATLRTTQEIGRIHPHSRPAAAEGIVVMEETVWRASNLQSLAPSKHPAAPTISLLADIDGDGDLDIVQYRRGGERHTGTLIELRRFRSPGENDPDRDGLTDEEEARLGTDPLDPDTDNDGLLDGWEVKGFRGLDLPALGCDPRRIDVLVYVAPFDGLDLDRVRSELGRVREHFGGIDRENADGSRGWRLHVMIQDPISGEDQKRPWQQNRDRLLPREHRGLARWMQITPGGGGQANQLGDGGTCGVNSLWAVFLHEFGHQLGLDHHGFWPGGGHNPIYPSLMNYAYSYSLEDDPATIDFSYGRLADLTLRETRLSEVLPLPYDQVKFLEKGPYRFRLRPDGDRTLIDWNWNGVLGERQVRADINYGYSTHAGLRDNVDKTHTSPFLFTHRGGAYVLFGRTEAPAGEGAPCLSPTRPGGLFVRRLLAPFRWEEAQLLVPDPAGRADGGEPDLWSATGDPVAAEFGSGLVLVYPSLGGSVVRTLDLGGRTPRLGPTIRLDERRDSVPSALSLPGGRVLVALWDPDTGLVRYRILLPGGMATAELPLLQRSRIPVGLAYDARRGEVIVGMAQDQDERRPSRWQVRRYADANGRLNERSWEWIEGEEGQARGTGRCTLLFDPSAEWGTEGRLYFFGRGMTTDAAPWACTFVAHTIGDRTSRGGWLVKRFYDEWTQSRSAPAATFFGGDILWSYRWVDAAKGPTDNTLQVGYRASGIEEEPMGDHDDVTFMARFGIRHGILWMHR
jgi:hypothetical protein